MVLNSIVPDSTFNEVLESIKPGEHPVISRNECRYNGNQVLTVTASVTLDRIIEIAKLTNATVRPPRDTDLQCNEMLIVECHGEVDDFLLESYKGQIGLWGPFGESL